MSLKKRFCNPPAERIAEAGDPEVRGLFEGAGRATAVIADEKVKLEFEQKVIEVEEQYMMARRVTAAGAINSMHEILDWILPLTVAKPPSKGGNSL